MSQIDVYKMARYMARRLANLGIIPVSEIHDLSHFGWIQLTERPDVLNKGSGYCFGFMWRIMWNYVKRDKYEKGKVIFKEREHKANDELNIDVIRLLREPEIYDWIANDGPAPGFVDEQTATVIAHDTAVCRFCKQRKPATQAFFPFKKKRKNGEQYIALTMCRKCKNAQSIAIRRKRNEKKK